MTTVRILLADDHVLVRAGIRSLLQQISGVEVVAEANNGREALHLVKEQRPNVVLMDIAMKDLNGIETTSRITKEFQDVHVIILSMHANEEYVLQALRAGAKGYLLKDAVFPELEFAIKAVSRGETYLSPPVSQHVIDAYRQHGFDGKGPVEQLSSRQREVLQLIAEGHTTKEIALLLNVKTKTVESHRTQLMERLGIHDVAGLVRFAIRMGIVSPEN
ncbi:MAG: response regulator transcription factor [Ignavibacteria bacterium]|nr:response regulator transcription factor [Ignavibacteria bacterium]